MNDKFDELAKGLAQSVTRRGALKQFGVGVAGMALAALGLANTAQGRGQTNLQGAVHGRKPFHCRCGQPFYGCDPSSGSFYDCEFFCGGAPKKAGGCSQG